MVAGCCEEVGCLFLSRGWLPENASHGKGARRIGHAHEADVGDAGFVLLDLRVEDLNLRDRKKVSMVLLTRERDNDTNLQSCADPRGSYKWPSCQLPTLHSRANCTSRMSTPAKVRCSC